MNRPLPSGRQAGAELNIFPGLSSVPFPPPAGIVSGDQIISSMRAAPRWHTVVMVDKYLHQPAVNVVVLAYFVSARRNGGGAYTAYCTSTYRQDQSGWKLIQHQQTPT